MSGHTFSTTRAGSGESSDAQLMHMALIDRNAFGLLFDRYWDSVFTYCNYRLGDWHQAEDAASRVFVRALAALDHFSAHDNPLGFRSWLFTIARNDVIDTHRHRNRFATANLDAAQILPDGAESMEEQIIRSEEEHLLRTILGQLDDDQRELLELRLTGLSAAEIGAVLGKSPEAVRAAQSRSIKALRRAVAAASAETDTTSND